MDGLQQIPPCPALFPQEEEKKELQPGFPPCPDLFAKEEPLIPEIIEPEEEVIPQRRLLPLGSKLAGFQSMAEKLFPPEKPLETEPMGGGLLREIAPPAVQERMAEATREPYRLDLEKALQSIDKAGADVLHGGIETATGLITGVPTFLAGTAAQGVEAFYNVLKDAYNSWKVGFKNVETFAPKPVAQYLLKTAGESITVSDFLHKTAEPYQPKTKTGVLMTETALAPVTAYMAGVQKVAEITSDDPGVQEGIVWLGNVALIFVIPKAKSYIKNQIRTKAPIITSKLKGMIIESNKVPREIKQKTAAVPDAVPEAPVVPAPKITPLPEPAVTKTIIPEEPSIAPEMPILKSVKTTEVPVKDIKLSKDVLNFKAGADKVTGVVPGKQLTGKFERVSIEPIVVWRRKNGDLEVITGRHKFDLAKRTGEKTIPAQIVDESSVHNKKWAMTIDAESNIRNEQGGISDYAQYFKNTEITESKARERSLLSRVKQKDGWRLGKDLVDDVYNAYIGNQIPESKALAIARGAPGNESAQRAALSKIKKYSPDELESFTTLLANTERSTMAPEAQKGLFGFDDSAIRETEAVAKEVGKEIRVTKDRILSVQGALKRPALAKEMGLEFTDEPSLRNEVARLERKIDDLKRVHTTPGLYNEMRERAGLLDFEPVKPIEPREKTTVIDAGSRVLTDKEYNAMMDAREAEMAKTREPPPPKKVKGRIPTEQIANMADKLTRNNILDIAVEDPGNSVTDVGRIKNAKNKGIVSKILYDEVSSIKRAAKQKGWDGIRVGREKAEIWFERPPGETVKPLTKKIMPGELALELKKKLGKEELTEKPEVKRKKQNFANVSVVTPTGEIETLGKFPERDISRVTDYAKSKGLSEKVIIGKSVKEAWEEGYNQQQRQASIEKRIDQLGKVPKEKWAEWEKKHAGYPMTEEIKKAVDAIQKRRGIKKRIKLEELKAELQKTDAGKVEWNFIEQEKELKELKKPTYRKAIDAVEHAVVDTSGNIKRKLIKELGWRGQAAAMEKNLAAGASSWATHLIEKAQEEIYGKGKSALSKKEEVILNRYLQSARTTAIHEYKPEVKRPGGLYDEHFEWQKDIPAKIKQAAVKYNKTMFEQLDALRKEGILSAEEVKNLKSVGMYEKSKFIQHIDPNRQSFSPGGAKMSVPDSGIKALKEGSENALELDSRLLLKEVIMRTQGRIFNNRANKSLYALAKDVPDNGIVRLAKVVGKTKKGILKYEDPPARHLSIKAMIDGKPKEMFMPDEYAVEWAKRDPLISQGLAQTVQWLSGNKILKAMATGINPGFAVTNLPRDIAHIYVTTDVYSGHPPVFGAQMLKDLMETRKDAFSGKGEWINYLRDGGGMNWLTFQGKVISGRAGTKLANLQDTLGKVGEVSERWTRLALTQRGMKMGMTHKEATAYARDYLDFYQGGSVIKALDQGIPYLNAGIQGTRGITRAIGRAPGKTAYKIGNIMAIASGLYIANNKINKECYDSITPNDKRMNWIITTPFSFKDKKGNKRHLFIKIAKDQGQRFFCSLAENMLNKLTGQPVNVDEITGSVQDAIQILPLTSLPPTISAILGYTANKDWWLNEDIWKGPKVKAGEEKTIYTHPALEKAGKAGLSPERLDYALKQIFTRGNVYTSIVSGGAGFLVNGLPEKDKGKVLAEVITRLPIIRRVFELTPPYSPKELKEQEKAKVEENTRKQKQKIELNKMSNLYYRKLYDEEIKDKAQLDEIKNFIREQPKYDQARLKKWFTDYGSVYNIPEKSWWLQLMNQSPEVRALLFFNKYIESDEKKKKEMVELLNKLPSLKSPRANDVFGDLMRAYKKAVK